MCPLIKGKFLGIGYKVTFLIRQDIADVPDTSFGVFCFSLWNDDEFASGGGEFVHPFHFCILPLPACSSLVLMPHNQLIRNVNQLLAIVALAFFTEPITN